MEFDGIDVSALSEIPIEDTAVVSIDGDIPQLKSMIGELDLYEENAITCNKLSAASSTAEAAADRCAVFRGIKRELPHHTVRNLPPDRCPMKRRVHNAFQSDTLRVLKLSYTHHEAMIDLISVTPDVLTKVATSKNIQC